jgi:hypothetical protein
MGTGGRVNPYVFFVGCPRSGTTLLRRIGDAHPELAIIRELHWLPLWWERRVGLTQEGMITPSFVAKLREHSHFRRLELDPPDVDALFEEGRRKHYARFVTELFDLHGEVKEKRLVGEKTPAYVRHIRTLHYLWPHAKIVHLIRDGRDVGLSLLDWSTSDRAAGRFPTWADDPITTAALFWEWNVRLGREAGTPLGREQYYELRYEALVADPELECRELCAFLGLGYDAAMLSFYEGRRRSTPGLSAKKAWQPVTIGLRSWRDQMAPGDIMRFEHAAGELLEELGYERGAASASDVGLAAASGLRQAFVDHARSCGWPVPEAWDRVAA